MPPLYPNDQPTIPGGQPGSQGYQGASAQPPGQAFARPSLQSATQGQKPAPRSQPGVWGQPNLASGGGGAGSAIPSQYLQPGAQRQAYQQRQQQYQQATAGQGGPTGGFFQSQPMQPQQALMGAFGGEGVVGPGAWGGNAPGFGEPGSGGLVPGGASAGVMGPGSWGGNAPGQGGPGSGGMVALGVQAPGPQNFSTAGVGGTIAGGQAGGGGVQFGQIPPGSGTGFAGSGQVNARGSGQPGQIAGGQGWMGLPPPGERGGGPGNIPPQPIGGTASGGLPSRFPPPPAGGWSPPYTGPGPGEAPPGMTFPPPGAGSGTIGPGTWGGNPPGGGGPGSGGQIPTGGGPPAYNQPNYWEDPETYRRFQETLAGAFGQGPGEALPAPTINQPDLSQINQLANQGGPAALSMPQQQAWLQAQQAGGPDLGAIQAATGSAPGGLSTPQGQIVDPNQVLSRIGQFNAGQAPSPYQAQNVGVNLPTGQTGYDPQTQSLMQDIFAGAGQGLPVEALKQQQTEQALTMQRQQQDQMAQQAAARGTFGSGQQAASERRLASDTQANILGANRDIDIQQALTQQQQRLQAAGLADRLAQSQFGRGAQAAGLGMQQGFGNEALQQAAAQSALGGYQAQTGAQLQGRGQDVQSVLAAFGLGQEGSLANAGLSAQVGLGQRGQDVTARGQNLDALLQGQGMATQVGMANAGQANQLGLGQRGQNIDQSNQALQALLGQRGQDITSRGQSLDALLAAQGLGLQGNTANANLAATYNMGTRGQNLDFQQAQNQGLLSSMLGMGNLGQQGAQLGLDRQLGLGNLGVAQQRANQEFQLGQSGQNLSERLAQMQNETSRYGIDQNTAQLLQQLGFNREQLGLQRELGLGGLDVDRARIGESGRQYNLGNQLGWGNLLNNATMGRLNYGLGLGELQQNGQNQLMESLFWGV